MPDGLFERLRGPFGGIFAGGSDPRLGLEQNAEATRQAIIQAGLATIIGASQPGASALASIAGGAGAGRAAGAGLREQAVQQQGQQEIAGLLSQGGVDLPQMRQALIMAIGTGDMETAKTLTALITSTQAAQPRPVNLQTKDVFDPETGVTSIRPFDPVSGRLREAIGQVAPTTIYESEFTEPSEDSPTGAFRIGIRRDTGGREILGLAVPAGGGEGGEGEAARVNKGLANVARRAHGRLAANNGDLARRLAGVGVNLARFKGIVGAAANFFQSDEGQVAGQVALQFLNPTVRFLSGAQMTEQETARYYRALMPRFGDREAAVQQKLQAQRELVDAMDRGDLPQSQDEALELLSRNGLSLEGTDEPLPWEPEGGLFLDLIPREDNR